MAYSARRVMGLLKRGLDTYNAFAGKYSPVYPLDSSAVVKVYESGDPNCGGGYRHSSAQGNAFWEFRVGTRLSKAGLNVPEMHLLISLGPDVRPMVVMQRLKGKCLFQLSRKEQEEAARQYMQQKDAAMSAGFLPRDSYVRYSEMSEKWDGKNVIFDTEQGRLYMHDLVRWRRVTSLPDSGLSMHE